MLPKASSPAAAEIAAPQVTGPTMNDQLRSQLIALNVGHQGASETRQAQLEAEGSRQLQGSVGGLPAVQTQFAAMNSDYDGNAEELQRIAGTATGSRDGIRVESAGAGQHFVVADRPIFRRAVSPESVLLHLGRC